MMTLNVLAWKNIIHNGFRSFGIALAVAIVTGTLFFVTSLMRSAQVSLVKNASRLGSDIIVVPAGHKDEARKAIAAGHAMAFYMKSALLDEVRAVTMFHGKFKKEIPVIEAVSPQLFYTTSQSRCCDIPDTMLIGIDPATDFTVLPWLNDSKQNSISSGEVIVGNTIPHLKGYKIQLYGETFTVAGKLQKSGNNYFDEAIFLKNEDLKNLIRMDNFQGVKQDLAGEEMQSAFLIRANPLFKVGRIANKIQHEVKGIQVIVAEEVQTSVGRQIFMLLRALLFSGAVLWAISFLIIAVMFSMIVNERVREFGLLRAMGATRPMVSRLTVTEALFLSFIGGSIGIMAGGSVVFFFKKVIAASLDMPLQLPGLTQFVYLAVICLILGLATGISAAMFPAIRSSLLEPATAIAKG